MNGIVRARQAYVERRYCTHVIIAFPAVFIRHNIFTYDFHHPHEPGRQYSIANVQSQLALCYLEHDEPIVVSRLPIDNFNRRQLVRVTCSFNITCQ